MWLEPPPSDVQEGVHLPSRLFAGLIGPAVKFSIGSSGREPAAGQDLIFECGVIVCFFLREHIVGLLRLRRGART